MCLGGESCRVVVVGRISRGGDRVGGREKVGLVDLGYGYVYEIGYGGCREGWFWRWFFFGRFVCFFWW